MKKAQKKGFTLVEIMIVVAIIGLLAAIGIPSFQKARKTSQTKACINNLRVIKGAKDQYLMDNSANAIVEDGVKEYLDGGAFPTCPAGGAYVIGAVDVNPSCPNVATLTDHTL